MSRKKKPDSGKLTYLGEAAEAMLKDVLRDMKADLKAPAESRQYTLTDHMKVIDRVAKFEAIRSKINDSEGDFFHNTDEGAIEND